PSEAEGTVVENDNLVELTDNGTLQLSDVDGSDEESFQIDPDTITSTSTLTGSTGEALGELTINAIGEWEYDIPNGYVEYLGKDETATEVFTVQSSDGTTHDITITIVGTNDAAVIISGDTSELTEDVAVVGNNLIATEQLVISDEDAGENVFNAGAGTSVGTTLGSLSILADGTWTYTIDNTLTQVQALDVDDTLVESFIVTSADGTEHTISVTVNGAEDETFISGATTDVVK
ncbi:VCBS domain-containing protein, partial [Vibrio sp. 10N.261.51.F12]|uniref:VCBS domain-containing protein n=1 Tax=Vibrio sp. 10N.261.51.F12 TaxID=3229679 RepID=UPI00354E9926